MTEQKRKDARPSTFVDGSEAGSAELTRKGDPRRDRRHPGRKRRGVREELRAAGGRVTEPAEEREEIVMKRRIGIALAVLIVSAMVGYRRATRFRKDGAGR